MNQIPNDSDYYAAASEDDIECDGGRWRICQCDECQGRREDYEEMMYERDRDEEM